MGKNDLFEKLIVDNKEELNKYLQLKGLYLHLQIYNILLDLKNGEAVTYYELSSIIRYDKNLRDKLYIYLATFEEKLRADLCSLYDVGSIAIYKKSPKLLKDLIPKSNNEISNLYYGLELDLGNLLDIYKDKKICDDHTLKLYDNVRQLRNKVMHHNVLLFGYAKTKEEAVANIKDLTEKMQDFYIALPVDFRSGFEKDINNLNYDKDKPKYINNGLCLGVMKNGICF